MALIVAKTTFDLRHRISPRLTVARAEPVRSMDEETELGCLPADLYPRRAGTFEVIVLGRASGSAAASRGRFLVTLDIGTTRREIVAFGPRTWSTQGQRGVPGVPAPCVGVPLVWEQAFGGSAQVWLDESTTLELHHPLNRRGRGFDPAPAMRKLPARLTTLPGYPRLAHLRELPGIERPESLITQWSDAPDPVCWATVPRDIGLASLAGRDPAHGSDPYDRIYDRAHPDWIIPVPRAGASVCLAGAHPDGALEFDLPRVRVFADSDGPRSDGPRSDGPRSDGPRSDGPHSDGPHCDGAATPRRRLELAPRMLLLQPERGLFSIVFRRCFTFDARIPAHARSLRLSVEEGWSPELPVD